MSQMQHRKAIPLNAATLTPRRASTVPFPAPGAHPHRKLIRLAIGDVAVSVEPADLTTVLGSCVAVCLHDPTLRAGGMNHIFLPSSPDGEDSSRRYGVHAMELLINNLMREGCDRRRLVAKAFGGANLFGQNVETSVGTKNTKFVREFLTLERIPLVAEKLGGQRPLSIHFQTDDSRVRVKTVNGGGQALAQERTWKPAVPQTSVEDAITLF
jgi:chemotaxis receptor (MCP) glutamine deamidase CheD